MDNPMTLLGEGHYLFHLASNLGFIYLLKEIEKEVALLQAMITQGFPEGEREGEAHIF